jgi:hypothetical protein
VRHSHWHDTSHVTLFHLVLTGVKCCSAGMLGGAAALVLAPQPARAEDDEVDDRYDENGVLKSSMLLKGEVVFQTVPLDGGSTYQVPDGWKVRALHTLGTHSVAPAPKGGTPQGDTGCSRRRLNPHASRSLAPGGMACKEQDVRSRRAAHSTVSV